MRRVYVGGAFTSVAAIIAAWVAIGVGGGGNGVRTCPPPRFPGPTCTGVPAGTSLTPYTGPDTITAAGTVIDGKDITTCLEIRAPGVVIKNSYIHCTGFFVIEVLEDAFTGQAAVVQDSTITCAVDGTSAHGTGFAFDDYVALRNNIYGCDNGLAVGSNVVIQDNWIHDLYEDEDSHSDGVEFEQNHLENGATIPGVKNVTVVHNHIDSWSASTAPVPNLEGNSAIITNTGGNTDHDVLIQNNLFSGGIYTLFCESPGQGDNYRVTGNRFSTIHLPKVGRFGPWTGCDDEIISDNRYLETGLLLTPN